MISSMKRKPTANARKIIVSWQYSGRSDESPLLIEGYGANIDGDVILIKTC
jgi:hypothetical protein